MSNVRCEGITLNISAPFPFRCVLGTGSYVLQVQVFDLTLEIESVVHFYTALFIVVFSLFFGRCLRCFFASWDAFVARIITLDFEIINWLISEGVIYRCLCQVSLSNWILYFSSTSQSNYTRENHFLSDSHLHSCIGIWVHSVFLNILMNFPRHMQSTK